MKFSVGLPSVSQNLVDCIIQNKDRVYEVYFSFSDFANGRNNQLVRDGYCQSELLNMQLSDLKRLHDNGIALNVLFNANCYGKDAMSRSFFNKIGNTLDYLEGNFGVKSVTTTSPLIAKFVKQNFEDFTTRASVNMEIGSTQGMDYVSEYFDSYYMKREYNRDFDHIKTLKKWCDNRGKKLFMLANSGCLNNCSCHIFHDNLVAHETEISAMDNAYAFNGICKEYLSKQENYIALVTNTNFVRPEDIELYEEYFEAAKLATRVSNNPVQIVNSYVKGKYSGNILELLEPNHNIYPYVLENGKELKLVKLETDVALLDNQDECTGNCNSCTMECNNKK